MAENNGNGSATTVLIAVVIILIIGLAFYFGFYRGDGGADVNIPGTVDVNLNPGGGQ